MTRRILIAVPNGEGVRNVLRTETFSTLKEFPENEIIVASPASSDNVFCQEFYATNIRFEKLDNYTPSEFEIFLGKLRVCLLRSKSNTIRIMLKGWEATFADWFLRMIGRTRARRILQWIDLNICPSPPYREIFERWKPDLVIVTRALNWSGDYPILKRAILEKVPAIALVASWDNLSSKSFFTTDLTSLVVWNDIMKTEAGDLLNIPSHRIFVSGVPRFDRYFRRLGLRTREEFCSDLGLDPKKKIVTYTTSTGRLFQPYEPLSPEPELVEYIADSIAKDKHGLLPAQLLVRLHPQESMESYSNILNRKDIIVYVPGKKSAFIDRILSDHDETILAETMCYSDLVVNICSTITIDAAIFDTPIICVGFDYRGKRPYEESVCRFYDFEHYRKLKETGGFRIAWSPEELMRTIKLYLENPSLDREGRERIVSEQCKYKDGKSGERVGWHILKYLSTT